MICSMNSKPILPPHQSCPASDVDADWQDAIDSGEKSVGGVNPTPDQDVVEELGKAVGLTYQDREPLHSTEKIEARDREPWELNPASAEDYNEQLRRKKIEQAHDKRRGKAKLHRTTRAHSKTKAQEHNDYGETKSAAAHTSRRTTRRAQT